VKTLHFIPLVKAFRYRFTCEVAACGGRMCFFLPHTSCGCVVVAETLFPDITYGYNTSFVAGCTEMGDVAAVIPAVHATNPGTSGTGHGINYAIADKHQAYVDGSVLSAAVAVKLLYGNAELAKNIAENKKNLMTIPEYIKTIDTLNKTLDSETFIKF
jgi:hypothetical protein